MSKQSDLVSVSQGSGGDPLYIDTTNDRVGVGTSSPVSALHIDAADSAASGFRMKNTAGESVEFYYANSAADADFIINRTGSGAADIGLKHTGDVYFTSGNVLVGKTSPTISSTGVELRPNGQLFATQSANYPLLLNRTTSDGSIAEFRKDNTTVGSIGCFGNGFYISDQGCGLSFDVEGVNNILPCNGSGSFTDNVTDLGSGSARFDDIYATNGTIQTSDRNEKQDIEALSEAEQRVAVAAKGLLRKYRWKDAVAEKGDAARIHFGIIAQDLQAAFEAEGLDAGRYGMFISSTWWEAEVEKTREVEQEDGTTITETYTVTETYDEATEGATERTRLGVRYPELLAFIIAAL